MGSRAWCGLWALMWVTGACGTDDGPPPSVDASTADAGDAATAPVTPAPPEAPRMFPCPDGWRESSSSGVDVCDPWPEDGAATCTGAEAHRPGEPGCAAVGSACPAAGSFADGLPTDAPVVYVLAGATGGDGSLATPWGAVDEFAWGALASGTTVAVGAGSYDGEIRIPAGITVRGACASMTTLASTAADPTTPVVLASGDGATVRDLTVASSARPGVGAAMDVALTMEGVAVLDTTAVGIIAGFGATIDATDVVVRGTRPTALDALDGHGLAVPPGATANLRRAVLVANANVTITADRSDATLTIEDSAVRDTVPGASSGFGLSLPDGAAVQLARTVVSGHGGVGLAALGAAAVQLEDVHVSGTTGDGTAVSAGVALQSGAAFEARRVVLSENEGVGMQALGAGTVALVDDFAVLDTRATTSSGSGRGLQIQDSAQLTGTRLAVVEATEIGIQVVIGASAQLEDLQIDGTRSRPMDGLFGRALGARTAQVSITRARLERNRDLSVTAFDPDTTLVLEDITVLDTRPRDCAATTCPDAAAGHGLGAVTGATITLTRFEISRAEICGLFVAASGGELDVDTGLVANNAVGACLPADYDRARVSDRVRYEDNAVSIDTVVVDPR